MLRKFFTLFTLCLAIGVGAQTLEDEVQIGFIPEILPDTVVVDTVPVEPNAGRVHLQLPGMEPVGTSPIIDYRPVPVQYFIPAVFDTYRYFDEPDTFLVKSSGRPELRWVEAEDNIHNRMARVQQRFMIEHPEMVRYNLATLPEAPKHFVAVIDPSTLTIEVREINIDPSAEVIAGPELKRRNWLHEFTGNVQFSQAYISPNWYQGGNNNLNMIAQAIWKVKLNQKTHPNLLFETTVQYKLGLNSAPDDSLRNYSISEDLFQVNSTFGVKAFKKWYYSLTAQFKTQLFNSYNSNSRQLRASLLSPGELNVGLGMTYNHTSASGRFKFDASIAPISWNLRTCISDGMDPTAFDILPGHKTASKIGSTLETKTFIKLAYNITYNSRIFLFTDYNYLQADWEHTLAFTINRFLSTQINVHLRYDTTSPAVTDSRWHKFQVKEILSFGFAYKFATL